MCNIGMPHIEFRPLGSQTDEIIEMCQNHFRLDLTPYKDEMIEYEMRGELTFDYLGPKRFYDGGKTANAKLQTWLPRYFLVPQVDFRKL